MNLDIEKLKKIVHQKNFLIESYLIEIDMNRKKAKELNETIEFFKEQSDKANFLLEKKIEEEENYPKDLKFDSKEDLCFYIRPLFDKAKENLNWKEFDEKMEDLKKKSEEYYQNYNILKDGIQLFESCKLQVIKKIEEELKKKEEELKQKKIDDLNYFESMMKQ